MALASEFLLVLAFVLASPHLLNAVPDLDLHFVRRLAPGVLLLPLPQRLRQAKRVAKEGASMTLETAKKLEAEMLRTEVSAIYVDDQYTRLFSALLKVTHRLLANSQGRLRRPSHVYCVGLRL